MSNEKEIWRVTPSLDLLNSLGENTLAGHIGMEFVEVGTNYLKARMPVDERTRQVFGILHGGASATLAETLGSVAGAFCVDVEKKIVVGLEINCNHVRSVREGFVYGTARPIHLGGLTQIWDIRILDEREKLVCVSRLTLAVLDRTEATSFRSQ
jgi:1,4-dihydroxy-2-naphthoyl-CoA hydrolase